MFIFVQSFFNVSILKDVYGLYKIDERNSDTKSMEKYKRSHCYVLKENNAWKNNNAK